MPPSEDPKGRYRFVRGGIALDMREALSGELFDGGVKRVLDRSIATASTICATAWSHKTDYYQRGPDCDNHKPNVGCHQFQSTCLWVYC